jgi:hypothetical protein
MRSNLAPATNTGLRPRISNGRANPSLGAGGDSLSPRECCGRMLQGFARFLGNR